MELAFIGQIIGLYKLVLIARIALSWLPHNPHNQVIAILYKITEPVLEPVRRVIPSIGGIDISPIIVFIALSFIKGIFS